MTLLILAVLPVMNLRLSQLGELCATPEQRLTLCKVMCSLSGGMNSHTIDLPQHPDAFN